MRWYPVTRDLFDLGAMVYIADELVGRRDDWARRFPFQVPVTDADCWRSNEDRLTALLKFLTGDDFEFQWVQTRGLAGYGRHRVGLPVGRHSLVCMFSGGLDSLIGALGLLDHGHRVLLVGHHADGVTSSAQQDLFHELQNRYGNQVELIQCRLARSPRETPRFALPPKVEDSHRSRSFLFLALSIAVARGAQVDQIVLAENGLIALNPPLGRSRIGSLSTRTAHPRYLSNFIDFVHQIGAFGGQLQNPFLYMSKTDIVRNIPSWQEPLVQRSVSCAHAATVVRWEGRSGIRHCGYCVPCIYRRVALMNAGLDRSRDYCSDVFRNLHRLSAARQQDMQLLVRFARKVVNARTAELRGMVVSHGTFPAGVGRQIGPSEARDYGPWAEMLSRWAADFLVRLEEHGTTPTKRILGFAGIARRTRARATTLRRLS